ncbi:hypothetical protein K439DRAFT_1614284 [Ramaria rubella]|nr:hypothetical protein K439DRAFT_1614284 [Ramaria rubella]
MAVQGWGDDAGAGAHGHNEKPLANDQEPIQGGDGVLIYNQDLETVLNLGVSLYPGLRSFQVAIRFDFDYTDGYGPSLDEVENCVLRLPTIRRWIAMSHGLYHWLSLVAFTGTSSNSDLSFLSQALGRMRGTFVFESDMGRWWKWITSKQTPLELCLHSPMSPWPEGPILPELFYGDMTYAHSFIQSGLVEPASPQDTLTNQMAPLPFPHLDPPPPVSLPLEPGLTRAPLCPSLGTANAPQVLSLSRATSLGTITNVPLMLPLNPPEPQQPSMDDLPTEQRDTEPMPKNAAGCKARAEFTYSDINKLLNAVLHVNPFMWQEVLKVVQDNGGCLGRDWETIRNKLKSVLKLVGEPNAKAAFPQFTLGWELDSNPQKFAILSGRIDAVAAMKRHAEQVLDEERDQVKEAQDAKATHGHAIRDAMLMGHARKSKHPWDDLSDSDGSEKENSPPASNPSSTSKPQLSAKRRQEEGFDLLASMFKSSMEKQHDYQVCQNVVSEALIKEHRWANEEAHLGCEEVKVMRDELCLSREAQERSNMALIDILKQGLL